MDNMTAFFSSLLTLIADFLASEPIIYLFGLICLLLVLKVLRQFLP